jgi:hypothetical protein
MSCVTVAKRPCYGRLKINPCYNIVHYNVIHLVRILWWPADGNGCHYFGSIIADGGRAIILIYREAAGRNKLISYSLYKFILNLNPSSGGHIQPLAKRLPGVGVCSSIKTMPLEGETAPSWWRCFCAHV